MAIKVFNAFRIKRSANQQEAMVKLTNSHVFNQYKDILMISALIGYNENRYVPIEKVASDGVLMQFFSERDYDIMDLIAYSHKKEQAILKKEDKYEIFSSYANGGFPILLKKLGIENINEIEAFSTEEARMLQSKYYRLLLSGDFYSEDTTLTDDDLFI